MAKTAMTGASVLHIQLLPLRGKASTVLILNVSQKSPNPKARYGGLVRWRSVELGLATVLNGILVKGGREHFIW
ncbi:hypothetical protein V6N13_055135 [Hibiscus sabdariffa]